MLLDAETELKLLSVDKEAKARFLKYLSPHPGWAEAIWIRLFRAAQLEYVPAGKRVSYYRLAR